MALLLHSPQTSEWASSGYSGRADSFIRCFEYDRSMRSGEDADVARHAGMLSTLGTEPQLRIMSLLLAADLQDLVPGDMREYLNIMGSAFSRHLEKRKYHALVSVRREGKFRWYPANDSGMMAAEVYGRSGRFSSASRRMARLRGGKGCPLRRIKSDDLRISMFGLWNRIRNPCLHHGKSPRIRAHMPCL